MKVTAFNGSSRGKKSITHIMVTALFEGMAEAGAEEPGPAGPDEA